MKADGNSVEKESRRRERSQVCGALATIGRAATAAVFAARGGGFHDDLLADGNDPFVLQEFGGGRAATGIAFEAAAHEVDAQVAELVTGWKHWLLALRDVVHDRPLVV